MEIPRRGGAEWFGDPLESGSFITSFSDTRPAEIVLQLALAFVAKNGYELTPELLRLLQQDALKREAEHYAEVRARGVPKGIGELLAAKRKKDVERIADKITIEAADFYDFCINCRLLGLSRHSKFQHFEPEQRLLTDEERAQLLAPAVAPPAPATRDEEKVAAKVRQLFVEREHRAIHVFANSDVWHCFFFSFEDIADDANHWRGGAHIHFVNHVFDPRLKRKAVWKALDERRHGVPKVHVRFRDPRQAQHDGTLVYLDGGTGKYRKIAPGGGTRGT
jgi:hypothetical protein